MGKQTVYRAMKIIDLYNDESILIGNIDTFSKPFVFSENLLKSDGFLEVFNGLEIIGRLQRH